MKQVRIVSKQTAMSQVARAVARDLLRKAIRTQKIALYMMSKGEPCEDITAGVGTTLALISKACEIQGLDNPDTRKLSGGLSACKQLTASGRYDPANTVAIDVALDSAELLNIKISAESMNQAVHELSHGKFSINGALV